MKILTRIEILRKYFTKLDNIQKKELEFERYCQLRAKLEHEIVEDMEMYLRVILYGHYKGDVVTLNDISKKWNELVDTLTLWIGHQIAYIDIEDNVYERCYDIIIHGGSGYFIDWSKWRKDTTMHITYDTLKSMFE